MTYSEVAASWKNKKLKFVVSLDQTLSDFRIIFAYHSGVIENPEIYVVADYQGALPEEVPGEIENLCYEIGNMEDKGDNIFKAAAYLHCKFENIHLFADAHVIIRTKLEKPSKINGLHYFSPYFLCPEGGVVSQHF